MTNFCDPVINVEYMVNRLIQVDNIYSCISPFSKTTLS